LKFKSFRDELDLRTSLSEEIKIIKKNWDFKVPDYTIDINDQIKHSLTQRAQLRTQVPLNTVKNAIQKGLEYVSHKVQENKLTNRTMISVTFTKSDFKALILVNPDEKYLRVSTIMDSDTPTKKDIKWNLNEFKEKFWNLEVNDQECFAFDCDLDVCPGTTFLVEPALFEKTHEITQQEDIENFNLSY